MKPLQMCVVALSLLLGLAQAQEVQFSPRSIVVNPVPSFGVEVFVDKDRSGEGTPSYQIGETIRIGVTPTEGAYVYLFNVRSTGEIVQILPNRFDQAGRSNFVRSGETKFFPPQGASYTFEVDGPQGIDKVIAVASKEQLDTRTLADFRSDPYFASGSGGERGFAQSFSIVVRPVPQDSWVTDTALFRVGSRLSGNVPTPTRPTPPPPSPPAATFGTLQISSNPSGAVVRVDGQAVGRTPVRYGTSTGSHDLTVELDGFETYRTTVRVRSGETVAVEAALRRAGATPRSAPANANCSRRDPDARYPSSVGEQLFERPCIFAFPQARLTGLERDRAGGKVEFNTQSSLDPVYIHFHLQLRAEGWERSKFDQKNNRVEATYERGGDRFDLDLRRQGNSGGYRLEVEYR